MSSPTTKSLLGRRFASCQRAQYMQPAGSALAIEGRSSKLLQVPDELLLEIMRLLPDSSIYFLRQTCHIFRRISADHTFKSFHSKFSGKQSFCLTLDDYQQCRIIRDVLASKTLCGECAGFRESGILKLLMNNLYKPVYCRGCRITHPALFFPPNQRSRMGGTCIGRLGHYYLCPHESVPWSRLGEITCTEHRSQITSRNGDFQARQTFYLQLERDMDIRKALEQVPVDQVCRAQLLDCPVSECTCFTKLSNPDCSNPDCSNHRLSCCGVTCTWKVDVAGSFVALDIESALGSNPTSPRWLSNLSFDGRNPLYDQTSKHVLWCNDPKCATNKQDRWLRMAKTCLHASSLFSFHKTELPEADTGIRWLSLEHEVYKAYNVAESDGYPFFAPLLNCYGNPIQRRVR
ncbi:hypothetical protein AK830_g12242 [Neonectria ditissima]|uniref:F-box domain-containing protein n=1 Tax=Neonectria ditissima TaxID=78410 RepID=A0A0P7AZH6_9HYPO|nr:hypothetical protein AK830_g12242 [Neonectria ditissima]